MLAASRASARSCGALLALGSNGADSVFTLFCPVACPSLSGLSILLPLWMCVLRAFAPRQRCWWFCDLVAFAPRLRLVCFCFLGLHSCNLSCPCGSVICAHLRLCSAWFARCKSCLSTFLWCATSAGLQWGRQRLFALLSCGLP